MLAAMDAAAHVELPASEACEAALQVVRRLREAGHSAYLVGGCVRDLVLDLEPKDWDVATSARPEHVRGLFRHVVEVGAAFGVLRVRVRPAPRAQVHEIEVATFRADLGYTDGRRPDAVRFTDAREDVARRDFTLNGLLLDPLSAGEGRGGAVVDFVGGLRDLQARRLRAIGVPAQRFDEDALRLLRAPRFAARFGLEVEQATADAIRAAAPTLLRVSPERVRAELEAMLGAPTATAALGLLDALGLAPVLWPDLEAAEPRLANTRRRFGIVHALLEAPAPDDDAPATDGLPVERGVRLPLALALLFWPVRRERPVDALAHGWRLSRAESGALERIWRLAVALWEAAEAAEEHGEGTDPVEASLIRLLREDDAEAALLVLLADGTARLGATTGEGPWRALVHRLAGWRNARRTVPRTRWWPPPALTGRDLQERGFQPGPHFRVALAAAEDALLEGAPRADAIERAMQVLLGPRSGPAPADPGAGG